MPIYIKIIWKSLYYMNYSRSNVNDYKFFKWQNPSAIDLAPTAPIELFLYKHYL